MTFPSRSVPRAVDLNGDGVSDGEVWDSSPTCALSVNGHVRCWGRNESGQLGYGHGEPGAQEHTPGELGELRESDRSVDVGGEVLSLADGGRCALRLGSDNVEPMGSVYCWGPNDHGQIGVPGSVSPSLTLKPRQIGPVHFQR
jgi:alpha-tubulin suppressor-like RCC1 family protein